ncbi:helix-turn-helix domain-containing protein [Escherichia coli]
MEMEKQDWHKADIIAALHKKGLSLASLSRANGLSSSTLANALTRDWPRGEIIIANAIGEEPQEIWPTRYFDKAGMPIKRNIRKPV